MHILHLFDKIEIPNLWDGKMNLTQYPKDSTNGAYGRYGAVVMNAIRQHTGIAVHSGRANLRDMAGRTGVNYATEGCIRTTDDAMAVISRTMHSDPIHIVTVQNNYDHNPIRARR
jgi:hypothetical protein